MNPVSVDELVAAVRELFDMAINDGIGMESANRYDALLKRYDEDGCIEKIQYDQRDLE